MTRSGTGDLLIRRATGADWPAMWPIWHAVVSAGDTYCYDPATGYDQARAMWLESPRMQTWLGEIDGSVAGFYEISPNHDGPGGHVANASYMVDEAVRGRGVGRALVLHSLGAAKVAGFAAVQFNAVAETNVGAIGLYERLGFSTVGIVAQGFRHPARGLVGLRIMHRFLDDQ